MESTTYRALTIVDRVLQLWHKIQHRVQRFATLTTDYRSR